MARLQDFQTVTPTSSDKILIVQSQGQGLATFGSTLGTKMDKANPTGTGSLSINRKANTTTGANSIAIGANCEASGAYSYAEGANTKATNSCAHSEGNNTTASGVRSHAEGDATTASGNYSHVEGYQTTASGDYGSHAEGYKTTASGAFGSHAEGTGSIASGYYAHAEGFNTIANHATQHVFGYYNVADTSAAEASSRGNYIEIVGNGTADNARSNARTLDWSGNEVLAGDLAIKGNISVNAAIEKTTSVVTMETGYSSTTNAIVKIGKTVFLSLVFSASTDIGSRVTVGKLPEGFRPVSTIGVSVPASTQVNYYANRLTNVLIASNGDIIVGDLVLPNGTVKEVRITTAFITS